MRGRGEARPRAALGRDGRAPIEPEALRLACARAERRAEGVLRAGGAAVPSGPRSPRGRAGLPRLLSAHRARLPGGPRRRSRHRDPLRHGPAALPGGGLRATAASRWGRCERSCAGSRARSRSSILFHRVHDAAAYEKATREELRRHAAPDHAPRPRRRAQLLVGPGLPEGRHLEPGARRSSSPAGSSRAAPRPGRPSSPCWRASPGRIGVVRSRLSWEGGDLQFTRDPRDARRLVLYYGQLREALLGGDAHAARVRVRARRWSSAPTARSTSAGSRPTSTTSCRSCPGRAWRSSAFPSRATSAVARAAVDALLARFGGREPRSLVELRDQLSSPMPDLRRARQALERARRQQPDWQLAVDPALPERMRSLVARRVPRRRGLPLRRPTSCGCSRRTPPRSRSGSTRRSRRATSRLSSRPTSTSSRASSIRCPRACVDVTLEKIGRARGRWASGSIRIPAFRVDLNATRDWPGISYVNALVVDRQIFVPRFGLGAVEDRLFREVGAQLPAGYSRRSDRRAAGPDPQRRATLPRRARPVTRRHRSALLRGRDPEHRRPAARLDALRERLQPVSADPPLPPVDAHGPAAGGARRADEPRLPLRRRHAPDAGPDPPDARLRHGGRGVELRAARCDRHRRLLGLLRRFRGRRRRVDAGHEPASTPRGRDRSSCSRLGREREVEAVLSLPAHLRAAPPLRAARALSGPATERPTTARSRRATASSGSSSGSSSATASTTAPSSSSSPTTGRGSGTTESRSTGSCSTARSSTCRSC